jgi:hypothetical protein
MSPICLELETGWAREPVRTWWQREPVPVGNRTPGHSIRNHFADWVIPALLDFLYLRQEKWLIWDMHGHFGPRTSYPYWSSRDAAYIRIPTKLSAFLSSPSQLSILYQAQYIFGITWLRSRSELLNKQWFNQCDLLHSTIITSLRDASERIHTF